MRLSFHLARLLLALSALAPCLPAWATDAPALPVIVASDDANILFTGRIDRSSKQPQFAWSGCAIEFTFNGTDANVLLQDGAAGGPHPVAGNNDNYFDVSVDGSPAVMLGLEVGTTIYRVASGLAPGDHLVTLYKRTEASIGKVTFLGLQLSTSATLRPPRQHSSRRIEFIGDSITAGFGDEATDKSAGFSPLTENNRLAYSGLTAAWLDADYSISAWSGIGAYRDYDGSTTDQMPVRYQRTLPSDPASVWSFKDWTAGAVVINLGSNDIAKGDPGQPFVDAYLGLLKQVRGHYPSAPIFCCLGPVLTDGNLDAMRGHIQAAMNAFADAQTYFVEFPTIDGASEGWGADGHPSLKTHSRMASQLVHEVRIRTGWEFTPPNQGGFVRVEGSHLSLNGGYFYFSGANSYSMLYSELDAEEQFKVAKSLGINAIRFWGFWNGEAASGSNTDAYGHYVLQPRPGVFPEDGWRKLDYVVYLAHVYGIKLIVTLNNEWNEFGGLNKYLEWAEVDVPVLPPGHYAAEDAIKPFRGQFWTNAVCGQIYRSYLSHMLNRVNTYTGTAYKDDPAIMIWEVTNEPRFGSWLGNKDATAVANWLEDAAQFVKSIDQNHLISTGEEGFLNLGENSLGRVSYPWTAASGEGTSFTLNAKLSSIDVLTIHAWPFQWSTLSEYPDLSTFIPEWIKDHLRLAAQIGKPLYLGEFGWQILRRPGSDVPDRDKIMKAAYDYAAQTDIAGVAVWHITASHDPESAVYLGDIQRQSLNQAIYSDAVVPNDLDFRFDIFCPEDKSTCGLIAGYSGPMTKKVEFPDPTYLLPCVAPWTDCNGSCVLLDSHPGHCGTCETSCSATQTCTQGECVALKAPSTNPTAPDGCSTATPVSSRAELWMLLLLGVIVIPRRRNSLRWLLVVACLLPGCLKLRQPATAAAPQYMQTSEGYEIIDVPETSAPSGSFVVDGKPFCFTGANNYYLTYKSTRMVDDVFAQAKALDLQVLRLWAFIDRGSLDGAVPSVDGDGTKDGIYFQYWDKKAGRPAYNDGPAGLQRLDYVLHKARETNLKVILVLTNNWTDFGGMDQYLAWYGLDKHHQFYSDERVKKAYKDYLAHLVNRKNSIDGIRYANDPAIFAWELANEPRCKNHGKLDAAGGWNPDVLTKWAGEMSAYLRSIDSNHLIAVGDEGVFAAKSGLGALREPECLDHEALLALPNIDFGTFHLYPETYGAGYQFGYSWIDEHVRAAQRIGKPTILEEYGIRVKRDERTHEISHLWKRREAAYKNWNNLMLRSGGNGSLFWMLGGLDDAGGLYPDYDHYTVYTGTETAALLQDYARRFNTDAAACKLAPRLDAPPSQFATVRTVAR